MRSLEAKRNKQSATTLKTYHSKSCAAMFCAVDVMLRSPVVITSREEQEREKTMVNIRAVERAGATELNFNYGHLHDVPHALTESDYCQRNVQRLYFKGNTISDLV